MMMTNPDKVAFTIFGKDIYWYGVLMCVGILVAIWLASKEEKRKGLPQDSILDSCLYMIPLGVVFARLFYVVFEWGYYSQRPIEILYVWQGGLAIYGALIGGLLGLWLASRHKKLRFLRMVDCIAPGVVLAQAIGRWGNFFNQEAFGAPVNNGSLMWFPMCVRIEGVHYFNGQVCSNPYHLATFFYESLWCFLVFIFLWSYRKKFKHDGDAFFTYALLYGVERMFVEGLRGDSLYLIQPGGFIEGGIRVSQLISFVAVAAVAAFFLVRRSKEKKLGRLIWPAPEAAFAGPAAEPSEDGPSLGADAEGAPAAEPSEDGPSEEGPSLGADTEGAPDAGGEKQD